MSNICVPYKDNHLLSDPKYRLYSVTMKKGRLPFWNIAPARADNEAIIEKFKSIQKYFENHFSRKYPADFYLKTISPVNNTHENVEKLDENTTSVFLGIFLKAFSQIKGWKFRKDWGIICVTGDLEYINGEPLRLVSIKDVKEKYNDEFTTIAKESNSTKCLFLYIADKEEKEIPQGESGNITVKWFSPNDTMRDILDCLFTGFSLPIQSKINLNLSSVAMMKNHMAKSYLEDIENIDLSSDVICDDLDVYETMDCFEGFISASICLLYVIEGFLRSLRNGDDLPEDTGDHSMSLIFIRSIGSFNKIQKLTAIGDDVTDDIDGDGEFDDIWDIDPKELPSIVHDKLFDFCPPRQSRTFYAFWNRFCLLYFKEIYNADKKECDLLFSVEKIKYKVLDTMDYCLDEYLRKYHNEKSAFWAYVNGFLISEFKLDGYERMEEVMDNLDKIMFDKRTKKGIKGGPLWREHVIKELNYDDDDAERIRNILNSFNDKTKGLQVAVNLLFVEQNIT